MYTFHGPVAVLSIQSLFTVSLLLYALLRLLLLRCIYQLFNTTYTIAMDRLEEDIVIRVDSAVEDEEVDLSLRDSRSTVKLPQEVFNSGDTSTIAPNGGGERIQEDLQSMMSYLVGEMRTIKKQLANVPAKAL